MAVGPRPTAAGRPRVSPAAVDVLTPYLPRLVIEWMAESPELTHRRIAGSIAFVDISGFTKLSERLARQGNVGAEQLTDIIGNCFSHVLATAYAEGSVLLKFGGDALLLLFTGPDHEVRSCRAAMGMRRRLREVGRLDVAGVAVKLRMSIGVHSGDFDLFLVGESHRELIVTGPAASVTVAMEATADAGEILVSAQTAAALRPGLLGEAKGDGYLLRRSPEGSPEPVPLRPPVTGGDLTDYLPVAVRDHLLSGAKEAEHRRATVAFVHFDGTDDVIEKHGPQEAARRLGDLVTAVQRATDRYGIAFLGTDIDRDGGKIILTAGVPSGSGDDERSMLLALRSIMDETLDLSIRAGVNRGAVFAGDIGPSYRRTFTAMGDTVNLAARLMAKAGPGELLASEGVVKRSRKAFDTIALEPFAVKGKSALVVALRVGQLAAPTARSWRDRATFVGRASELAQLRSAARSAAGGSGALFHLVGEPGLGKSRLVEELSARTPGLIKLSVVCEPYGANTQYLAARGLLRDLLGIPRSNTPAWAAAHTREIIATKAPQSLPWAPLIAAVMGIDMPDTPESAQLEDRFRRQRLGEATSELLAQLLTTPTLITIDDGHRMDEASADLFRRVFASITDRPWLVCVTGRDRNVGFPGTAGLGVMLTLQALGQGEAADLARRAGDVAGIAPHELDALVERSGGNPLFLRELCAAAATSPDGLAALPDSVEALITARIDGLPAADRTLLRRASVLGGAFSLDLLAAVIDVVPAGPDPAWQRLAGFLVRDESGQLSFEHGLVRDAAYEGLPYRLRQRLHAKVADVISAQADTDPDAQADLLSFHYFHAHRYEDAWRYSLIAAERASKLYANLEAAECYERALQAHSQLADRAALETAGPLESLGDMRNRLGGYAAAETAYRQARHTVVDDPVSQARLFLKTAVIRGWMDRPSTALRWITRGLRAIETLDSAAAARQRAQLLVTYGQFCQEQGRHKKAVAWCRRAIAAAEQAHERGALAHALKVLCWAQMALGHLDSSDEAIRALEVYEDLGDLSGQASVFNTLGGFAYWRGEWAAALEHYEHARDRAGRAGDLVMQAFCAANIGEIALDQGRVDDAEELFTDALRVWRAASYRSAAAFAVLNLARVAYGSGRYDEGLRLLEESLVESREVGAQVDAHETSARIAECLLLSGDVAGALKIADETLAEASAVGGVAAEVPLLHRIRGAAYLQLDAESSAAQALEQSVAAGRARKADYEIALTLQLQAVLAARTGDPRANQLHESSQVILDQLGVVSTLLERLPSLAGSPSGSLVH